MPTLLGPNAQKQLNRLRREWNQGEHVVITAPTGYGKTVLARKVLDQRIARGSFCMVFVGKLSPDPTLQKEYPKFGGWRVWKKFQKPTIVDNKILLIPHHAKAKTIRERRDLQREVFADAFDKLAKDGKWTIQIDEGLYTTNPSMLNLGNELAIAHAMGRSSGLTIVTLAQRPAHIPLIIYSSATHSFSGRSREPTDLKRLSEVSTSQADGKELRQRIGALDRYDFLWLNSTARPEVINVRK